MTIGTRQHFGQKSALRCKLKGGLPSQILFFSRINLKALLFSVPLAKTTSSTNSAIIKDNEMRTTASAKSHGKTSSSTLFDSPPNAKKKAPPVSNADIELKIAPVKKAARIAAKVREYRQENEEGQTPKKTKSPRTRGNPQKYGAGERAKASNKFKSGV